MFPLIEDYSVDGITLKMKMIKAAQTTDSWIRARKYDADSIADGIRR
jgi:hypothetical protein